MGNNLANLDQALPFIKKGETLLFIGSGLSKIAGCYGWDEIVDMLIANPIFNNQMNLNAINKSNFSYDEIIDYCRRKYYDNAKENDYWAVIRGAFLEDYNKYINEYLPLIKKIKTINPFPPILTTNIDNCLEKTKLWSLDQIYYELKDFKTSNLRSGCIFHIHGFIEDLKNALITRSQYLPRYNDSYFRTFMLEIFKQYSVIFMGYGLREFFLKNLILEACNGTKPRHFALFSDDEISHPILPLYRDLYKIEIVSFGAIAIFSKEFGIWIDRHFGATPPIQETP